jgi:hypothetical protein
MSNALASTTGVFSLLLQVLHRAEEIWLPPLAESGRRTRGRCECRAGYLLTLARQEGTELEIMRWRT